jgi:dTMP kinase
MTDMDAITLRTRRPSHGRIIALVGIDGSGKSTQAATLAAALRNRGERARAFENPGGRPVLDGVAHRLGRADGGALIGRRGRVAMEITVRTVAIARAVAWARLTGGTAVMDRYAVCQLATMHARGDEGARLVSTLARLAPAPDALVYLKVDPTEAQRRVSARGRDEESLAWLSAFAAAYAAVLPTDALTLDAAGPADHVAAQILSAVGAE